MKHTFKFDFIAGLSVFLVAIPLCLGIALASGAPLIGGLLAGIIGGIVVGFLSNSHLSVSGPAAGLVAIIIAGITEIGSYAGFAAALVLAGMLQIVFGLVKAGKFTKFLPHSVIEGMMAAIGFILILKQYPVLLGQTAGVEWHGIILALGVLSLALLVLWDKFFAGKFKLIPGSLIVVILGVMGILLMKALGISALSPEYFVSIPVIESFDGLKSILVFPDWEVLSNPMVYKTAIVLALVASIESLLCINAVERLDPLKRPTDKNRELLAQGTGNALSGLVGGLPITSVIVRSSVNLNAGAKTKASAIIHGFFIVVVCLFGAGLMNYVPLVSLAAILMYTGYKLAHPKHLVAAWKSSKEDFIAFVITAVVVVLVDLLVGVLAGLLIYYILVKFLPMERLSPSENTHQ